MNDLLRWLWHADGFTHFLSSQYGEHDLDREPKRVPDEEYPKDTGIDENVCGRVFHKGNVRVLAPGPYGTHPRIVNLFTVAPAAKTCLPKIVGFLVHPYPRVCDRSTAKGERIMTDAESFSKVRSGTAEYLYLVLQSRELGWEASENAEELLLETGWYDMIATLEVS